MTIKLIMIEMAALLALTACGVQAAPVAGSSVSSSNGTSAPAGTSAASGSVAMPAASSSVAAPAAAAAPSPAAEGSRFRRPGRGPMLHAVTPAAVAGAIHDLAEAFYAANAGATVATCTAGLPAGLTRWRDTHLVAPASFASALGADGGQAQMVAACTAAAR